MKYKLNQWYLFSGNYGVSTITELVYLKEYDEKAELYKGCCVSCNHSPITKKNFIQMNDLASFRVYELSNHEICSYKEAREYIDTWTAEFFNLCE